MFEILRDPMWQFVAAILALVAIILSIVLYSRQRQRKALSYEIVSSTALLSMEEEVKQKMQILFNGKPVQQVHLFVFKIINSGNLPILATDYERPVSLSFGEKAQILTAEVAETNPDSLRASAKIEGGKVVIMPTLLNQGDMIKLKMLVSKFDNQITVDGRIVGVKDIKETSEPVYPIILEAISVVLVLIGFFGIGVNIFFGRPVDLSYLLSLVLGYILMGIVVFWSPPLRKRLLRILIK